MATTSPIRQAIERMPGVKRTWFELDVAVDGNRRTLVVEVEDTDMASEAYDAGLMRDILDMCIGSIVEEADPLMKETRLRIVPVKG